IKTAAITAPQLRARRRVDAIGRTVEYKEWSADNNTVESTASSYDNDNRLLTQKFVSTNTLNPSNNSNYTLTYSYYKDKSDQLASWDGAGALASVSQSGITTLYTYDYWDDAKQLLITKRTADQNTTTTLGYDLNGHIKSNVDAGTGITQDYITNANGQVLLRMNSGTPYQNYYYADGHRVGEVGNVPGEKSRMSYAEQLYRKSVPETADQRRERYKRLNPVTSVDFDQNYEPINDSYPGRAASNYAVRRNGETLRSVAQALWGDSSMWYLIAEANGMLDDTSLSAGQVLVIPNKVTNIHNNASTWRPYNPGEAIGNVDPNWSAANIQGIKDFPAKLSELISHAISSAMWTTSSLGSSSSYSYQPAYSDPFGFDRAFFGNGAKEKDDAALDKAKKALKSGDIAQQREALTGLVSRPEFTGAVAQQVAIQQLLDVSYNFSASLGTPLDSGNGMQMGAVSVAGWNWSGQGLGAFGNALGSSLAEASRPETQGVGPYSSADYRNGSDIESDNYTAAREAEQQMLANNRTVLNAANVAADPSYYSSPTPEQSQAAFRQSERDYRQATDTGATSMAYRADDKGLFGAALRAAGGDRQRALAFLGTWSDQGVYETNRNGSPIVQDGQSLPWVDTGSMSADALVQSAQRGAQVLSGNSATMLANAQRDSASETQRELNRFAAMSEAMRTAPAAVPSTAFEQRLLQPGESIRGNLFFGGAGMDGAYIKDMVRAFGGNGIALTPVDREKWSGGTLLDASVGVDIYRDGKFPIQVLLDNFHQTGPQFNLVGYSYGSVAASQVAINYAQAGTQVDNLVLIGAPIGEKFLNELKATENIKNVVVINLTEQGDPIHAGMTRNELLLSAPTLAKQMVESSGHFYYAPSSADGQARRDALAAYLYSKGVR
ncbi:hypothetical protein, partial [Roseateles sp. P5_E11]